MARMEVIKVAFFWGGRRLVEGWGLGRCWWVASLNTNLALRRSKDYTQAVN